MGYWNYRICQHGDGHFSLNEVYYDDEGKETSMTARAIGFVADADEGPEGIVKSLEMALRDARERPVFKVPERWESAGGAGNSDEEPVRSR